MNIEDLEAKIKEVKSIRRALNSTTQAILLLSSTDVNKPVDALRVAVIDYSFTITPKQGLELLNDHKEYLTDHLEALMTELGLTS